VESCVKRFRSIKSSTGHVNGLTGQLPLGFGTLFVSPSFCNNISKDTFDCRYFGGRVGVAVTTASFLLATVLLLQQGPRFSQLSSAIFGLFYCGYLPCFWIKLRCGLAVPAINTSKLVFVQLLCAGLMIEHISPSVLLHSWRTSIGQINALW
jgi:hypothetical protein